MLGAMRGFAAFVDGVNARIGNGLSVLVWFVAIVCAFVVVLRYVFLISFTWMQELYVWIHALVFLAGASYAMLLNAHVRVDILYNKWPIRTRTIVEIIGAVVFTLPWLIVLAWLTWPFIVDSWRILEGSPQPNGMPGVYAFKTLLIMFSVFMTLQCLAVIARGVLVLAGDKAAASTAPYFVASDEPEKPMV
jgi:TRAP-type mannitol/chloroaromatic compound transport system permease small subunit